MAKYSLVVCGGTFDLFHKGHEELIKKALSISEKVLIGITSNFYVESFKNNYLVEDYALRKKAVKNYLKKNNALKKASIVPINFAYEPYLETSSKYQAIVVSDETKKTAERINISRKKNKIRPLDIIIVHEVFAKDNKMISSTRIRNGEINKSGMLYVSRDWENKDLLLPSNLRSVLKSPWGKIIKNIPSKIDSSKTIVVGDATSIQFNKKNVGQFLSIIDFLINREQKFKNVSELGFKKENILRVKNPPGIITFELFNIINNIFKNRTERNIILIEGEDDLAVLPIILIAPLGFNIFYGQPNVGIVRIIVNEQVKERAYAFALKLKISNKSSQKKQNLYN